MLAAGAVAGMVIGGGHTAHAQAGGLPELKIKPGAQIQEGNSGTTNGIFPVTLSAPSAQTVSVRYATVPGSATATVDYVPISGVLTFAPGVITQNIVVAVKGDVIYEPGNELFEIQLFNPVNATVALGFDSANGLILDDEFSPLVEFTRTAQMVEGDSGLTAMRFTVSLTTATNYPIDVTYRTENGSATAYNLFACVQFNICNGDYSAASGTLTFAPGERFKTITVNVIGDANREFSESFYVNLTSASGAVLEHRIDGRGQITGTIINDD
jgi:hypothetical protein